MNEDYEKRLAAMRSEVSLDELRFWLENHGGLIAETLDAYLFKFEAQWPEFLRSTRELLGGKP